ncbi:hypothetical protein [Paracoccus rhizosphaerae]|uniref:Uncharacterized protein n=1 Tax=Paracoccus rhizosphaerae TaxID=1133347 RepID=A0ABV6CQA3_9RHOB|nr:hypothetical protein [Paracoccus rhizosphaerae]
MATHCHNTPGTSDEALRQHCSGVQTTALQLCGVIEAIEILDDAGTAANAVTCLIRIARSLADQVNNDLDSVNLPKGGAAC